MTIMKSKQEGAGVLGWLMGLMVIGLLITLTLKLVPIYLDDYALKKVISSLDDRSGADSASVNQVRLWIDKGLQTNLIKMQPNEWKVHRENDGVVVDVDYERRLHFLYNIDLILTFKYDWKVKSQ